MQHRWDTPCAVCPLDCTPAPSDLKPTALLAERGIYLRVKLGWVMCRVLQPWADSFQWSLRRLCKCSARPKSPSPLHSWPVRFSSLQRSRTMYLQQESHVKAYVPGFSSARVQQKSFTLADLLQIQQAIRHTQFHIRAYIPHNKSSRLP